MEQQGTVINRTFVLLNFRSIILAPTIYQSYHEIFVEFDFCHHIYNIYKPPNNKSRSQGSLFCIGPIWTGRLQVLILY